MDKALETQLANIQKRTGKSADELVTIVKKCGLAKHGEMVAMLKDKLGMGHGDANLIVHMANKTAQVFADSPSATAAAGTDAELDRIYTGPKAALRPIHEKVMASVSLFGPFEIAPKKTYLSLRRAKQFAMVGPATNTRLEVGLNMKGVKGTSRLSAPASRGTSKVCASSNKPIQAATPALDRAPSTRRAIGKPSAAAIVKGSEGVSVG